MGERRDPLLEQYRAAKRLPEAARARLWDRIETSVSAGRTGPRLAPEPRRTHRRAWLIAAAVCAAAIVALLCIEREILQRSEGPTAQEAARVAEGARQARARRSERLERARKPGTTDTKQVEVQQASPSYRTHAVKRPKLSLQDTTLAAELAVVKAASLALERSEAKKALALLDRHEALHGEGQLREERMALRVQALCALGKGPQARGEARLFEREFPGSVHAKKVRDACKEAEK